MKLSINPPSGYTNSYLDIKFTTEFNNPEKVELELFNLFNNEKIEIIGCSSGYISNNTTIIAKNSSKIEGYINLFNRDKLNLLLKNLISIDILAKARITKNNKITEETAIVTFYNESKSADSDVIPFDLTITSKDIETKSNNFLELIINSRVEKKYELSIMDDINNISYFFEIITKNGTSNIKIPIPILFHELKLDIHRKRNFNLYWTKFEGVSFNKLMNRNSVKIPYTSLNFKGNILDITPQNRFDPVMKELPNNFVLSDRYLVHTHKDFSGFGSESFSNLRIKRLTFFMHESQSMQMQDFNQKNNNQIKTEIRRQQISKTPNVISFGISKQKQFLENFSNSHEKPTTNNSVNLFEHQEKLVKKTGCGCSRKK